MQQKFKYDMTSDTAMLKGLSDFVLSSILPTIKEKSTLDDLLISIDEVATNIILHAYQKKKGFPIHLEIDMSDDKVVFTFYHSGSTFDPSHIEQPHLSKSMEEREVNGMGLYIIKQFMDSVEYIFKDSKNKENKIILTKYLKKD